MTADFGDLEALPMAKFRRRTIIAGNKVRLSWKSAPGRRYEILFANGLEYVFQPIAGAGFPRVASSTEEHFDDTLPAGPQHTRFYRLRLVP